MMEKRRCQVDGCEGTYYAKGFCVKHYQRNRLQQRKADSGKPVFMETAAALDIPAATPRVCQVPGCDRKHVAKGFCAAHYQRNRLMSMRTVPKEVKHGANKDRQATGHFTGIVRELDALGRIVLPIELRRVLDIDVSDSLEIFVDGEKIILRKYAPGCIFCGNVMNDTLYFKGKIVCKECISHFTPNE